MGCEFWRKALEWENRWCDLAVLLSSQPILSPCFSAFACSFLLILLQIIHNVNLYEDMKIVFHAYVDVPRWHQRHTAGIDINRCRQQPNRVQPLADQLSDPVEIVIVTTVQPSFDVLTTKKSSSLTIIHILVLANCKLPVFFNAPL